MNNRLITVKTFTFSYEVDIPRSLLESEGIYCFAKDEYSIQIQPYLSSALGGVKLQVMEQDVERAIRILEEGGYFQDEDLPPSPFLLKLYKMMSKIPLIKRIYR